MLVSVPLLDPDFAPKVGAVWRSGVTDVTDFPGFPAFGFGIIVSMYQMYPNVCH